MAREILTRDDADPATLAAEAGYVKRIFKRIGPAVVWLTLLDGTTIGVTPETRGLHRRAGLARHCAKWNA